MIEMTVHQLVWQQSNVEIENKEALRKIAKPIVVDYSHMEMSMHIA